MSQAERIVQILDRLSRYGRVTTKEIMNIYQVSDRQVRRDISYIKASVYLIFADKEQVPKQINYCTPSLLQNPL